MSCLQELHCKGKHHKNSLVLHHYQGQYKVPASEFIRPIKFSATDSIVVYLHKRKKKRKRK